MNCIYVQAVVIIGVILAAVRCTNLAAPSNGQINYQNDTSAPFDYQTTATYSCNSGYGLSPGDRVRTCIRSAAGPGEWSGTAPTCLGNKTVLSVLNVFHSHTSILLHISIKISIYQPHFSPCSCHMLKSFCSF